MTAAARNRGAVRDLAPASAALGAALLLLGPGLAPGHLLVRDAVFVPDPPLTLRLLGVTHETPRAVPSDAVAAVLTHSLGGWATQVLLLLGALVVAGWGVSRLVPGPTSARCAAAVAAVWNPYVAERVAMGHWALLLGYSALPWVLAAAVDIGAGRGGQRRLLWSLAGAALGGAVAWLLAVLGLLGAAFTAPRLPVRTAVRRWALPAATTLALALPWILPGILRPLPAGSSASGFDVFGPRSDLGDVPGGTVLGVLGGGGIWNSAVVPEGRDSLVGLVLAILALAVPVLGWAVLRPRARTDRAVLAAGVLSLGLVATGVLLAHVPVLATLPGAGLLRDATRSLGPWALVLAVGVGKALTAATHKGLPRPAAALTVLLPLVLLPGAAWGVGGRLGTVEYPGSVGAARAALDEEAGPGDTVLVLPWEPVRRYPWNADRASLTPWSRMLSQRVVTASHLTVSRPAGPVTVPGDDPLADEVGRALGAPDPPGALVALGVDWVLVDAEPPPGWLTGARDLGSGIVLGRLHGAATSEASRWDPPLLPVVLGDVLVVLVLLAGHAVSGRRQRDDDAGVTLE